MNNKIFLLIQNKNHVTEGFIGSYVVGTYESHDDAVLAINEDTHETYIFDLDRELYVDVECFNDSFAKFDVETTYHIESKTIISKRDN